MNRASVSLTPASKKKLELLSMAMGCSVSAVASKAIEIWLEEHYDFQIQFWTDVTVEDWLASKGRGS